MTQEILLSGFAGAIVAQLLSCAWTEICRRRERKTMLSTIEAECKYNLSIVDEILDGVINAKGSFKRLSVDYFRYVREKSSQLSFSAELLAMLSHVCIDMDLFNLEVSYVFNGQSDEESFAGVFDDKPICMVRKKNAKDIGCIVQNARNGVCGSLEQLRKIAKKG